MEYVDRVLPCIDCGVEFVFSAGEQAFFGDKGFLNNPRRCVACRTKRKFPPKRVVRQETVTTCAQCGKGTTIPFKPVRGKPVFCRMCFMKGKEQVSHGLHKSA
jgi:CxxC-x17-CxxC domain-containing protein